MGQWLVLRGSRILYICKSEYSRLCSIGTIAKTWKSHNKEYLVHNCQPISFPAHLSCSLHNKGLFQYRNRKRQDLKVLLCLIFMHADLIFHLLDGAIRFCYRKNLLLCNMVFCRKATDGIKTLSHFCMQDYFYPLVFTNEFINL